MDDKSHENWGGAERPSDKAGRQYHIACARGEIARYVLLPGDPGRVPKIAAHWDTSAPIASHREHTTYTGTIGGTPISACSTGMGGGSTSIALEELAEIGADTFLRVGTCGAIQEHIKPGDLIICTAAVRGEGASDDYVIPAYPAAANYEVTLALIEAAERLGHAYHVGVAYSSATFFCGQGRPGRAGYTQSFQRDIMLDMRAAGVLAFEMEAATVFTVAGVYGLRAGAVFTAVANRVDNAFIHGESTSENSIETANLAVRILWDWERRGERAGKQRFFPSLPLMER